jgi:hypothetical protein
MIAGRKNAGMLPPILCALAERHWNPPEEERQEHVIYQHVRLLSEVE